MGILVSILLLLGSTHLQAQTEIFNFTSYSVEYDYEKKCPLWVQYKTTREMVQDTAHRPRVRFWAVEGSADYNNYKGSGYDRGHCAPFATFDYDYTIANETMCYLNIVPQSPFVNRGSIAAIEKYERSLANSYGCINTVISMKFSQDTVQGLVIPSVFDRMITTCNGEHIVKFITENFR